MRAAEVLSATPMQVLSEKKKMKALKPRTVARIIRNALFHSFVLLWFIMTPQQRRAGL